MNNQKQPFTFLPGFVVGLVEGLIVVLALFCFLLGKGLPQDQVFLYTGIAVLFIAVLLGLGAYYTRREELENRSGKSRIIKIYQSLDIDDKLRDEMVADTEQEKKAWEEKWVDNENATGDIHPDNYGLSVFSGFMAGGIFVLANNLLTQLPNYSALLLPFLLLAALGFLKYHWSGRNAVSGMLLISVSGIASALGAYYAGSFFI